MSYNKIILFDGDCNFCNKSINFIIKRDSKNLFKFARLQGVIGKSLLNQHNLKSDLSSLILIDNKKVYDKSSAVLNILKSLGSFYALLYLFIFVPKPLRDFLYSLFAKYRYKFWGSSDFCLLPSLEISKKFLD
ncbi:DUF393 domain-containing protein [Bacillus sp. AGMB 02131]|uniref:DUF393 domain-containing protein n=1 Tax=Peribacillus faecalis TaxID=2772559 RepID=A0A927CX82_9BACI|nr:DCC1-like thiol-disulfide oxidoreductase family protein [Peribacillus faecalis]MBD3108814.1 DUF393 domain-containing protein [Peribacillus faecalis]